MVNSQQMSINLKRQGKTVFLKYLQLVSPLDETIEGNEILLTRLTNFACHYQNAILYGE